MQVINLEATITTPTLEASINTPSLNVEMRTLRLGGGGGGTTDYNDLTNKPKIEGVTLQGNVPISDLGLRTSDLINDSGFITTGDIPTKTSDLTNDSDFQTGAEVAASITAAIPTNVSYFTNDIGYITSAAVPTDVSAFTNDVGYLTANDLPSFAVNSVNGQTGDVVLDGSNLAYDANDSINDKIDSVEAAMPTDTNDLTNGAGYITAAGAPVQSVNTKTGAVVLSGDDITASPYFSLTATVGTVLANHGLQIQYLGQQIPTKTSDLNNDSGFITAAGAPVQSVNGQTGTVILKATDLAGGQAGYEDATNAGSTLITTNAAENIPVVYLNVAISPIQASGTPTPSDPLPITGLTDVVVEVTDSESNLHIHTIPLGQTVYGGTLNVTTGELKSDMNKAAFDGTEGWTEYARGTDTVVYALSNAVASILNENSQISNIFAYNSRAFDINLNTPNIFILGSSRRLFVQVSAATYPTVTDFQTALSNNNLEIVYNITEQTYTLTPTEVKTYANQCIIHLTDCDISSLRFFTAGSEFLAPQVKTILQAFNLL